MANAQALCTSFKVELLQAYHAIGTPPAHTVSTKDVIKCALILASKSLGAATTAYSSGDEITSSTGYSAGGATVTNATEPGAAAGTTAFWTPSASVAWTGFTQAVAFDAALLYNSSQGNRAIGVYTFGSQTITAGTFTLTMPTNDASTGLIRIA
jgi:hypothetical protein